MFKDGGLARQVFSYEANGIPAFGEEVASSIWGGREVVTDQTATHGR